MIDTIRLYIARDIDLSKNKKLSFSEEKTDSFGEVTTTYFLYNIRVYKYSSGISISGSLTKYALLNNYNNATRDQIRKAANSIANIIGFDLSEAFVTRIDLGVVFETDHSTDLYLPYLHAPNSRYKQNKYVTGVKFYNNCKSIILYDKYAEMKYRKDPMRNKIKDKNLLRYEVQIKENCKDFLMKECNVKNKGNTLDVVLSDEYFDYYKEYMKDMYKSISITESIIFENFPTSPKELQKFGLALWLKNQNSLHLKKSIDNYYGQGIINAHNRRNMIRLIHTLGVFDAYEHNLMSEMEEKIISEIEKY